MGDIMNSFGPWVIPALAGAAGQLVGLYAGTRMLTYRVDRLEVLHDNCTKQRVEAERVIGNELFEIKTDVAVIKTKIDRRNNGQ